MKQIYYILKVLIFTLTLFNSIKASGQEQIKIDELNTDKIPKGIKYEGKIKNSIRWIDSLGENIVITTETGIHKSHKFKHENDGLDAELFVYHFIVLKDSVKQTWKVYDFISDCPVDIEASFIKNTFQVTDLNKDGVAEIWLMYKTACRGDVSPSSMKIIMYQGQQKFAMRGRNKVFEGTDKKGNKYYDGGEYKFDQAFSESSIEFRNFAKKLWNENIIQTWGD